MAKLGHPLGEVNLTRGAGETDMLQVISSNSSCSLDELVAEKAPDQQLAWQLYVAADRARAERTIKHAVELGVQSIWLTVDAPVGGKRERDLKEKIARDPPARDFKPDPNTKSESAVQFSYVDADLCWDDIAWIRKLAPGRPIVLKGIQCVEDAVMAAEHGVQGIVLSNHGGRQLDGSRPPIEVLQEIRKLRPELLTQMEVFVDGGIRRGTDVLKALALGAKAVGMGRPFLYAQSAYGAEGVVRAHESESAGVWSADSGGLTPFVPSHQGGTGDGDAVDGCHQAIRAQAGDGGLLATIDGLRHCIACGGPIMHACMLRSHGGVAAEGYMMHLKTSHLRHL